MIRTSIFSLKKQKIIRVIKHKEINVHLLVWMVFLSCVPFLSAQKNSGSEGERFLEVYPIRENHKWGYCSMIGDKFYVDVKPIYDLISEDLLYWNSLNMTDKQSPYRLFEKNGKVGLLDNSLKEHVPGRYIRIKPLSHQYFAVTVDSLFTLMKKESDKYTILWADRHYHNIVFAECYDQNGKPYFLVKERDKWGVTNEKGEVIIKPRFSAVRSAGFPGFFMAQKPQTYSQLKEGKCNRSISNNNGSTRWGLVTPDNRLVLDYQYKGIVVLDSNTYAALSVDPSYWQIFVDMGDHFKEPKLNKKVLAAIQKREGFLPPPIINKRLFYEQCSNFAKLSDDLAVLHTVDGRGALLFNLRKDEIIQLEKEYDDYFSIDGQYVAAKVDSGKMTILDENYREIIDPDDYTMFLPSGIQGSFRAMKLEKWGILSLEGRGKVAVNFQYDTLDAFKNGFARCWISPGAMRSVGGYGVLSYKNGVYDDIPCQFDTVYIGKKSITTIDYDKSSHIKWLVNEKGQFDQVRENQVRRDKVQTSSLLKEAEGVLVKAGRIITAAKYTPAPKATSLIEHRHKKGLSIHSKHPRLDTALFVDVRSYSDPIAALYTFDKYTFNQLSRNTTREAFCLISFLDTQADRLLSTDPVVGFRSMQKRQKYTAFIDAEGLMGLLDKSGQQKIGKDGRPLRYTYIGPFQGGYARVCKGGVLLSKDNTEKEVLGWSSYRISSLSNFILDYNIKIPQVKQKDYSHLTNYGIYVLPDKNDHPQWGFINEEGDEVVAPQYAYVSNFSIKNKVAYISRFEEEKKIDEKKKALAKIYYGLLDSLCTPIIDMQYRRIGTYGPYFVVEKDSTPVFFYDSKGREILVNRTRPGDFSEGFAPYRNEQGKWGFIDTLGRSLGEPLYKKVRGFSDGLAAVILPSDTCAFINKQGTIAFVTDIPASGFDELLGDFSDNRCPIGNGKKYGYLDKKGNPVIPYVYLKTTRFSHGVATVIDVIDNEQVYLVIDEDQKPIVGHKDYKSIRAYNRQGYAHIQSHSQKWGIIDATGHKVIPPVYDAIQDDQFVNGYVRVKKNDQLGLVNYKGEVVLETQYAVIDTVSEGMVAVKESRRDQYQIYNIQKKRFILCKFKQVEKFKRGVSLVQEDNELLIIDRDGNEIIPQEGTPIFLSEGLIGMTSNVNRQYYGDPYGDNLFISTYPKIEPHKNGVAKIQVGRRTFQALNDRGIVIVPPKYPQLFVDKNGFVGTNPNRFYGLMDYKGRVVVPVEYDRIFSFENTEELFSGFFRVETGEKVGYIKTKNGRYKIIRELQK
jgi:hypothetical protein